MPGNKAIFSDAVKKGHNAAWDGEWSQAADEYRRALAEFPGDASVRSSLAQALEELGQWEDALTEYQTLARAEPRDPLPLLRIAALQEKMRRPAAAAGTYLAAAELFLHAKLASKAIEAWKKAAELEPERADVHQRLAESYSRSGQPALASLEHLALAQIYRKRDDKAKARSFAEQAVSIDPHNQAARAFLEGMKREINAPVSAVSPVDQAQKESLARLAQAVLAGPSARRAAAEHPQGEKRPQIDQHEVDTLIARAIDAQAQRRFDDAIEAYRQLVAAGMERPEVKFNLGLLYSEMAHYEDAIALLSEMVNDKEYELASCYALGKCYRAQGKLDRAVERFLQVVRLIDLGSVSRERADDLSAVYAGLAENYVTKNDPAQAEAFSRALEEFLGSHDWKDRVVEVRRYLELLRAEDNQVTLAEVIQAPKADKVLEALALSQEYVRQDQFAAATDECYRAIEWAPSYLPAHVCLAEIMARQNRASEANSKFLTLGELCLIRGDLARAENMYRRALQTADDDASTRDKLIDLLLRQNRTEDALAQYLAYGDMYVRLGQLPQALEKLNAGLRLVAPSDSASPSRALLRHRLAETLAKQGNLKGALAAYQEIRRQSPDDERAHFCAIELELHLRQVSAALRDLDDLLARYQTRGESRKAIGVLEALAQDYASEAEIVMRLARLYQTSGNVDQAVKVLDALGDAQLNAGQTAAALETIRRIVELNPPRVEDYKKLLEQLSE